MGSEMAQTEAEPPTSAGTSKVSTGKRRLSSGGPGRPLLNWPVAFVAILAAVLVLLIGGGLFLRQVTAPSTPVSVAAPTSVLTSAPTVSAPPTTVPQTSVPAALPPASSATAIPIPTPLPTSQPTDVPTTATQAAATAVTQLTEARPAADSSTRPAARN
jgi:hypothetical protein